MIHPIAQVTKRIQEAEKNGKMPALNTHFRYTSARTKDAENRAVVHEKRDDGYCVCDVHLAKQVVSPVRHFVLFFC